METKVKRYYVVVRGQVQEVGYRKRIEGTAELFNIKGFPWNDVDGSVKMICEGQEVFLNRFLEDIEIKEEFPLPPTFARLEIEELGEISGKLDVGNERLKGIEANTLKIESSNQRIESSIGRVEANTGRIEANTQATVETLGNIDSKLDTLPERIAKAIR